MHDVRDGLLAHPLAAYGVRAIDPVAPGSTARLAGIDLSVDSIVATVVLTPAANSMRARVYWGDGTFDEVDFRLPVLQPDPNLPPRAVKLQHVYAQALFRETPSREFRVTVVSHTLSGERTTVIQRLTVTPHYRVRVNPTLVKATHHDGFDEHSEFDIELNIRVGQRDVIDGEWRWEPKTFDRGWTSTTVGIVAEFVLRESGFSAEANGADEIVFWPDYVDDDGLLGSLWDIVTDFPVEFDESAPLPYVVGVGAQRGPFQAVWKLGSEQEYMEFHFSGSVDLIVPLERRGPVVARG